jgi:hypothetical protein
MIAGCTTPSGPTTAGRNTATPSASAGQPAPEASNEKESTMTPVRVTVHGQTHTAQIGDNPTARYLVDQLPLTLTFRDFNGVEKIAKLPRALTTQGVPAGADPDINDIGYYAPSGDLVFYYGDVGYFDGIVRIGRFDDDIDSLQRQPDGFEATIERA